MISCNIAPTLLVYLVRFTTLTYIHRHNDFYASPQIKRRMEFIQVAFLSEGLVWEFMFPQLCGASISGRLMVCV